MWYWVLLTVLYSTALKSRKKWAKPLKNSAWAFNPRAIVRHLSVGQRQRVEILKALYRDARVLILDEPTAVLVPQEVDLLFDTLNRLRKDGLSVIFISHKLDEVTTITDRVTVLRDGNAVGTVDTSQYHQE